MLIYRVNKRIFADAQTGGFRRVFDRHALGVTASGGTTVTLSNLTFGSRTATSITPRLDVDGTGTDPIRYAVYLATDDDPPHTAGEISSGDWATWVASYALDSDSTAAPGSTQTGFDLTELTGLSAGQSYKLAAAYDDGSGTYTSVVVSGAISTLSAYAETHGSATATAATGAETWALNYAETHDSATTAAFESTDTFETPSVDYDETHGAACATASTASETWSLGYVETHGSASQAAYEGAEAWALGYAETHGSTTSAAFESADSYAVGNQYPESHAATTVTVATAAETFTYQWNESHAAAAVAGAEHLATWALGYAETHGSATATGSTATDVYDTPAPGVFDETHGSATATAHDAAHTFTTPAAIGRVTAATLKASGTKRTLKGRTLIN